MICLKKILYEQRKALIMKYKVGDKVRIIDKWVAGCNQNRAGQMDHWLGKVMTICKIFDNRAYFMEEDRGEHCGDGWLWNEKCIAGLADNHKIVITSDGKETLARLYDGEKVIKSAVAKCSPDDKFSFNFGANLAFERLMNEEKKEEHEGEWRAVDRRAKAGDYIRLLSKGGYYFNEIGDILKVHSADACTGGVHVLGRDHKRDTTHPDFGFYYTNDEFEVVERVSTDEKPREFKIGDKVRITAGYAMGKTGEIVINDGTDKAPWGIKVGGGRPVWKYAKNLELIEDKPKFEVGKYYKYSHGICEDGVIKVVKVEGDRAYYKIINGLADDNCQKNFNIESYFANCLTLIEDYQEKPKYYNGKVVCVMCDNKDFTVGKVYEFKDGTLVDDQGAMRYDGCRIKHPSEIVNIYKFIPFVE